MSEIINRQIPNAILWFSIGYLVSVYLGGKIIPTVLNKIKNKILEGAQKDNEIIPETYLFELFISGKTLGYYERALFTLLIAFNISGTASGMFAYVTLKMIIDWMNIITKDHDHIERKGVRSLIFRSLIGSLISMLFAVIGGLICGLYKDYYFWFI
jgi:hypothetical protein